MKLTNEQKNEIRELLQNYVGRYPSQNKAANSLIGISAGTVSTILNGRYESISDEMFVKLRAQISGQRAEGWQLCRTRMYQELSELFSDAQQFQNVAWAIAPAGSGKTTTARDYASQHENVCDPLFGGHAPYRLHPRNVPSLGHRHFGPEHARTARTDYTASADA